MGEVTSSVSCDRFGVPRTLPVRFSTEPPSVDEIRVARAWCAVLAAPATPEALSAFPLIRWSDAHRRLGLQGDRDVAFDWALRSFYLHYQPGRLQLELSRSPQSTAPRHQIVTLFEKETGDGGYAVAAKTVAYASISGDTVVLASALSLAVEQATHEFETQTVRFIALGETRIDTLAAWKADTFVRAIRARFTATVNLPQKPRYFVTPRELASANATLGILMPIDTVTGFTSKGLDSENAFVWAGSVGLGERYYHELVHLALVGRSRPIELWIEESVAYAFGGTMQLSFDEWLCQSLEKMLSDQSMSKPSDLFRSQARFSGTEHDDSRAVSLVVRLVDESASEPRVVELLDALPARSSRADVVQAAARVMGLSGEQLLARLDRAYSPEGLAVRCGR